MTERERDNLEGAKKEAEGFIQKERDIRRKQNVLYQKNAHDAACNVKVLHCSTPPHSTTFHHIPRAGYTIISTPGHTIQPPNTPNPRIWRASTWPCRRSLSTRRTSLSRRMAR